MHLCALWLTSGSFSVAWFIGVRPCGRRVRSRSLGAFGCARGDVRFVKYARKIWVYWEAPWCSLGSFGFAEFIGVRPWCRRVLSGSQDSLGCALGVFRFVRGQWIHFGGPWGASGTAGVAGKRSGGRRISSWLLCLLGCTVVSSGSFGVAGFIGVRPGGVGFVQGRLVYCCAP